ncbi:MFS transporter [Bacillus sp. FJAT-44742]|uniref:MFS transporter n=1 Tax=Bacillus sp. FJAT-44742 TaxID=2014005 RepID=UPI000C24C6E4|nr:MFS transporter [Bacillus sp. FJAT-44742]
MEATLHIFIEYRIKEEHVKEYEALIENIAASLSEYGAEKFQWYAAEDQPNLYVELFKVPTKSHYHTLKKWRKSKEHPLFGKLDPVIDGGLEKLNCWAFQARTDELKE